MLIGFCKFLVINIILFGVNVLFDLRTILPQSGLSVPAVEYHSNQLERFWKKNLLSSVLCILLSIFFLCESLVKFIYSEKATKFFRNLPLTFIGLQYIRSKVRGRFRKILWPSQNIWTLFQSFHKRWEFYDKCTNSTAEIR